MSILVNKNTKVICQGITGTPGTFHTKGASTTAPKWSAASRPGKGGTDANGLPVFDTVAEPSTRPADATVIFVPPPFAADAIMEAADAGIA